MNSRQPDKHSFMAVTTCEHADFLQVHKGQLVHSAVPEHLWLPLHEVRSAYAYCCKEAVILKQSHHGAASAEARWPGF